MMLNKVSLNTIGLNRIGLNRIGKPSRASSDRPYIDPEVLASLKAVCICYGKSNDDPDRAVVKNLVDPDNPFVISNATFKLNSGFGEYAADFLDWTSSKDAQKTSFEVKITSSNYKENWVAFKAPNTTFKAMKVRISGIPDGGYLQFFRTTADGGGIKMVNGINEIPAFTNTVVAGFYIDIPLGFDWSNLVIEQIPSFEGAFVTDGIDDLITSTKSATEMLDGSNEITVVSMIHQIKTNSDVTRNNWFFTPVSYLENRVVENKTGKTGIYGYTSTNVTNAQISDITPILGDKNDYTLYSKIEDGDRDYFTVEGFQNQGIWYVSSIAWYWTIIANKVLTTDQINQVIAYYNLDRCVEPTVLYDVKRQGLSNDTPDSDWYLKDFSKNGFDMSLFNFAKKGNSGVGKYETDLSDTRIWTQSRDVTSSPFSSSYNGLSGWIIFANTELTNSADMPSFKIQVKGLLEGQELIYRYYDSTGQTNVYSMTKDGEYTLPSDVRTAKPLISNTSGFQVVKNDTNSITITQIPSHAGALCLDGVNDFGKVTGMPIYKDYTIVVDYERISGREEALISKAYIVNQGAFVLMETSGTAKHSYSFGAYTAFNRDDFTRTLLYQSKYKCGDVGLNAGAGVDGDTLWLGTFRDNDKRFFNGAIYSLMSFPYSMSEFLIERQLKKHKLGTLYPDMVEFRPIVKSNSEYQVVDCYIDLLPAVVGKYYPINSKLRIAVTTKGAADEITSLTVNGVSLGTPSVKGNRFTFNGTLSDKSPQKINITIDEYIRYEDIVQPYPSLFTLIDYDTEEVYSWGSKLKVGARFKGNVVNLLPNMYEWQGDVLYNGEVLNWGINPGVVAKEMVFSWNMPFKYLIDNNEPKCILSPRLLRIPNSSYKILGYIPDISGHGNNGVIHNSAYAEGSGVNEDGSYQLDGVDDFVTIPTLSSGGKQVLMKVNLPRLNEIIYDQRKETNTYTFAILTTPSQIAYDQRNSERITYIDGILNTNIIAEQLMGVTHNIVVINSKANLDNTRSPILGRDINGNNWSRMRIYDFMLFDGISTDDKIKELNEYVGIEGDVWGILTKLSNSTLISNETLIKNE